MAVTADPHKVVLDGGFTPCTSVEGMWTQSAKPSSRGPSSLTLSPHGISSADLSSPSPHPDAPRRPSMCCGLAEHVGSFLALVHRWGWTHQGMPAVFVAREVPRALHRPLRRPATSVGVRRARRRSAPRACAGSLSRPAGGHGHMCPSCGVDLKEHQGSPWPPSAPGPGLAFWVQEGVAALTAVEWGLSQYRVTAAACIAGGPGTLCLIEWAGRLAPEPFGRSSRHLDFPHDQTEAVIAPVVSRLLVLSTT